MMPTAHETRAAIVKQLVEQLGVMADVHGAEGNYSVALLMVGARQTIRLLWSELHPPPPAPQSAAAAELLDPTRDPEPVS